MVPCLIFFLCVSFSSSSQASRTTEAPLSNEEALHRGVALHRAGEIVHAAAIYRAVVDADPSSADALHLLGLAIHQAYPVYMSAQSEAALLVKRAWDLAPTRADIGANLGEVLRASGDLNGAVHVLRRVTVRNA